MMQSLVQTTDCRKFNLNKRMTADTVRTSAPPPSVKSKLSYNKGQYIS